MTHYDEIDGREITPSLGCSAGQLTGLSRKEQDDARLLALIAQRDPVLLARLLALAAAAPRPRTRPVLSAQEAIEAVGTDVAYAAMRAVATADPDDREDVALRQWMLRYSVNLSLTARRVAAAARLDDRRFADLCVAALFDVIGVRAALATPHRARDAMRRALADDAQRSPRWPREAVHLDGYWRLSASIARRWGAGDAVAGTIRSAGESGEQTCAAPDAGLLWLSHALLDLRAAEGANPAELELPQRFATPEIRRLVASRPVELAVLDA